MTTKSEMVARIRKEMRESGLDYTIIHKDDSRELLVVREYNERRGRHQYLSSTHWGMEGALGLKPDKPGDVPHPRWSSGGVTEDATPEDLAEVMMYVWEDALDVIRAIRATAEPSSEDGAGDDPRP